MAYNTSSRFPPPEKPYKLLDPGSYQNDPVRKLKINKCPFNSCTPRKTMLLKTLYTDAIYAARTLNKIVPNITSFKARVPRFPHDDFKIEDFEAILCDCDKNKECNCNETQLQLKEEPVVCQGKIPRRLIIGKVPRPKDSYNRKKTAVTGGPPFYEVRVHESTEQYHGWKWSQRTSKRSSGSKLEQRPGPADYTLDRKPTAEELCQEQFRSCRRRNSRQLRYMDMVLEKNLRDHMPSPAHYSPQLPGVNSKKSNPLTSSRFPNPHVETRPGPTDHNIVRLFSPPYRPTKTTGFRPPNPPYFGSKDHRFKPRKEEGPSPASYSADYKGCRYLRCSNSAPFGTSALRWKETPILNEEDYDDLNDNELLEKKNYEGGLDINCPNPQWMFKSHTERFRSIKKYSNEDIQAKFSNMSLKDSSTKDLQKSRNAYLQFVAPFNSSEGKFQPWHDWMPYHARTKTPGVGYYSPQKARCLPAVVNGPLSRVSRFGRVITHSPAPNKYDPSDCKFKTFNKILQDNMDGKIQYKYNPLRTKKLLNPKEKFKMLLEQSIKICVSSEIESDDDNEVKHEDKSQKVSTENVVEVCNIKCLKDCRQGPQKKLLRSFLYKRQIPCTF